MSRHRDWPADIRQRWDAALLEGKQRFEPLQVAFGNDRERVADHWQPHLRLENADVIVHPSAQFARQIPGMRPLEWVDVQVKLGRDHSKREPIRESRKFAGPRETVA